MNMEQQVDDLIVVTGRLSDLLEQENEALRQKDNTKVADMVTEKNVLTRAYEVRLRDLADQGDALASIDAARMDELRRQGERTDALVTENSLLLRAGTTVGRHVIEAIAEAVQAAQPGPGIYSANGMVNGPGVRSASKAVAITINESL